VVPPLIAAERVVKDLDAARHNALRSRSRG
jgi:hypothetical protein